MNELTKRVAKRTTCPNAVTKLLLCACLILVGAFSATVLADRHSPAIPHEHEIAVLDGDGGLGDSTGCAASNSKPEFAGKRLWQIVADTRDTLTSTASTVMTGLIDGATTFASWTKGALTKATEGLIALAYHLLRQRDVAASADRRTQLHTQAKSLHPALCHHIMTKQNEGGL